ncbi:hypothetical protein [Sphingosinithalassobacter sp. LHW66-3]|uniref:hypothetical protein n=1 Tax=Sphingosinithalassobacter sp. LHW66-3 TaxID=3424718 RepID=UPI003D6A1C45
MIRRVEAAAERRAAAAAERLAERIASALPGVRAERSGMRVTLSGRDLARRALTDPVLRWLGGLLR